MLCRFSVTYNQLFGQSFIVSHNFDQSFMFTDIFQLIIYTQERKFWPVNYIYENN